MTVVEQEAGVTLVGYFDCPWPCSFIASMFTVTIIETPLLDVERMLRRYHCDKWHARRVRRLGYPDVEVVFTGVSR